MATIKGQNLRVMYGGVCIAAATSCTLHVAMQTEDSSTKDDDGDFATVNPVGLSWDVSVDALVTDGNHEAGSIKCEAPLLGVSGFPYVNISPITLRAGDRLSATTNVPTARIAILDKDFHSIETGTAGQGVQHEASATETVYIGCSSNTAVINYAAEDDAERASSILESIGGAPVTIALSYTVGTRNRTQDTRIVHGMANLTDFSLTASNRQNAVYTASFEGTGELTLQ